MGSRERGEIILVVQHNFKHVRADNSTHSFYSATLPKAIRSSDKWAIRVV